MTLWLCRKMSFFLRRFILKYLGVKSCLHLLSFFKLIYFIYYFLFWVALGLCCCVQAFSSRGERGLLFVVVRGLLTVVASLVAEHGL